MKNKKKTEITIRSSAAEYLTFIASTGDNEQSLEMRYQDENIWLTQKMMATLYDVTVQNIGQHIKKIFDDNELPDSVIKKFFITAADGKDYDTKHYNLQMIIAVGFKVNNERAVQFRKWAGQIVKDYTIQGWTMDVERMKKGHMFTDEDFDRQLQYIREIRLSERKFYQKITDIYATSLDYDPQSKATQRFFATVQNKMHWAIHKPDVVIAKNYLSEPEMAQLERMVSSYLDFGEDMALRKIPMTMADWETRLNGFIELFDYGLLQDAGKVSAEIAKLHAETEFEKYRIVQDRLFESDFDRFIAIIEKEGTT
jgi:hypothetical protein